MENQFRFQFGLLQAYGIRYTLKGMRKDNPIEFSSDEMEEDVKEVVPYLIGRNAQRLAARSSKSTRNLLG